jgi:two-component system, NarL family, nitrate/nitrite response regulator NarL
MVTAKVLIADTQYLTRVGLRVVLEQYPGIDIVGEAVEPAELMLKTKSYKPDIVLLDYHEPSNFGPEIIAQVKIVAPEIRLLVISADNDKNRILSILKQGAEGFLTKSCEDSEIYDAIKALLKGNHFYCNKVLNMLLAKSFLDEVEDEDCSPTVLSTRELEVVKLAAKGNVAKEIGDKLNLSVHTVYTHRKNIMKKLNLKSSSDLVLYAYRTGILETNK